MIRSVLIYGGLLTLTLGVAWMRWTAEPEQDLEGQIVLLQGDAEDIQTIIWRTDDSESIIEQRSDAQGSYLWVNHTKWTEKKVPVVVSEEGEEGEDAPAEDAPAEDAPTEDAPVVDGEEAPVEEAPEPEVERIAEVQAFKAGAKGDELLASLSPMMAIRRLEGVDETKLESIGLAEPTGQMVVTRKDRTATLDV
ncbi:MAG: hypothetical protein ACI8RZ_006406, partial [Myxococcota bacterium]